MTQAPSLSDHLNSVAGQFSNHNDYWNYVQKLLGPGMAQHYGGAGTEAAIRAGLPSAAEANMPAYGGYWSPPQGGALLGALGG